MILLFAAKEKPYEKAQGGIAKDFRTLGTICLVMIAFCSELLFMSYRVLYYCGIKTATCPVVFDNMLLVKVQSRS